MAGSVPPFRGPVDSLFSSLSLFSQSLSKQLGSKSCKVMGAGSTVTLGLTLVASRAPAFADKKNKFEKSILDALNDCCNWPFVHNYSPFASTSVAPIHNAVEPQTGVVFPGESPEGKQLAGIGLRKKNIMGLKKITVYAYGLYADTDSLKSSLGIKYGNFPPTELSRKKELFHDVVETDVGLTVRLIIVYGKLKIGSIRSAFEESVGKGLRKFSGDDNKELLGRFTSIFTDDLKLPKGTTIDISRLPGQVLQTKIDGQEIGSVESPLLCQALFDLYIGEDAFDKTARETMGLGFAEILSS